MTFFKEKIKDIFLLDTPVENIFINEYMQAAPGDYVKVYLLSQMYAGLGEELEQSDIARHLNMDPEDVLKAWTYWERLGVIRKHMRGSENKFDYDVEFVLLKDRLYGTDHKPPAQPAASIGTMMTDPQVKDMIAQIEQTTGRVFNSAEMQEILSWIEEYQVQPETIAYAFTYSKKKKKTDIRYVGKIVRDWGSQGMKTVEAVSEYLGGIDRKRSRNRRIFRALGFNRNATEEEERIMDSWFEELNLPLDTVLSACAKTSGITSPNINYVNKVLTNWHKEGKAPSVGQENVPTPREVMAYYELLRQLDERAAEANRRAVYRKVPRIREIEDEIGTLNSDLSRIIISDTIDKKKATRQIREKMDALNIEKAFLLTDNGYELDHMEVHYECPVCKDTGILETGEKCQCFGKVTRDRIKEIEARVRQ